MVDLLYNHFPISGASLFGQIVRVTLYDNILEILASTRGFGSKGSGNMKGENQHDSTPRGNDHNHYSQN